MEIPPALATAFASDPAASAAFAKLSCSHRKEHVRTIVEAKQEATRERRIAKLLETLRG